MRKLSVVTVVVGQAVTDLQLGVIAKKSQDFCGNPFLLPTRIRNFRKAQERLRPP